MVPASGSRPGEIFNLENQALPQACAVLTCRETAEAISAPLLCVPSGVLFPDLGARLNTKQQAERFYQ
jgi:hypothetical protein